MLIRRWLFLLIAAIPAVSQIPSSPAIPSEYQPQVRAEIQRLEDSLPHAADQPAVTYELARTWASVKQWPEAVEWLQKAVAFHTGIDPSREALFAALRGTREFEAILDAVRQETPPVSHSRRAFPVEEGDLVPESIAYDPVQRMFYLGSMRKGKVIRCRAPGLSAAACTDFATGLGTVLGLKAAGRDLWVLNNGPGQSELIRFDLGSGRATGRFGVKGSSHELNDLAIAPAGDVYVTDTPAAAIWHLPPGAEALVQLPGRFPSANGITVSPDAKLLYVSTFPDGITVVDLRTGTAAPLPHPGVSLMTIDGLYFDRGKLIAIQNAFMNPRVIRVTLSRSLRSMAKFEILERRNPLFEGTTTGVIAGREFFYMANIQDDKQAGFTPITILKIRL